MARCAADEERLLQISPAEVAALPPATLERLQSSATKRVDILARKAM
jgi:hypothetical protein